MSKTRMTAFLDQERDFDLLPKLQEMERVLEAGTGIVVKRIIAGEFLIGDLQAVVRLALIGAGMTPKEAAALTAEYVTARPLAEGHALATTIVLAAWSGVSAPALVNVEEKPAPLRPGEHTLTLHTNGSHSIEGAV